MSATTATAAAARVLRGRAARALTHSVRRRWRRLVVRVVILLVLVVMVVVELQQQQPPHRGTRVLYDSSCGYNRFTDPGKT